MNIISKTLIVKNTLTNYLVVGIRLLEGILLTRLLYAELGQAYYGFWGLLWSFFAYVLLLDFGLSQAAQKHTSRRLFETEPDRFNKIVSSVFGIQFIMSGVIIVGTLPAAYFLEALTNLSDPTQLAYCRKALVLLGIGVAITFPTGIFPAMLVALHKIYLRNYVTASVRLLELCGIYSILKFFGGGLISMVIYCVCLNISANLVMLLMVKKNIPSFKPRLVFSWSTVKSLLNFSFYIYITALANLIATKTDRLVLGIFSGLEAVGLYQLSTRLPEMAHSAGTQFHENLTPLSAALSSKKADQETLRQLIYFSMRISAFLTMAIIPIGFLLTPEALNMLFGIKDKITRDAATLVCRIMLVSVFFSVGFRSVAAKFMTMADRHKLLAGIQISEAVINLLLSIFLVRHYNITKFVMDIFVPDTLLSERFLKVIGVVLGTLLPNIVISIFIIFPYMCKFIKMNIAKTFLTVYIMPALAVLPAALALFALRRAIPVFTWVFPGFVCAGLMTLMLYCVTVAFCSFSKSERKAGLEYIREKINFFKKNKTP